LRGTYIKRGYQLAVLSWSVLRTDKIEGPTKPGASFYLYKNLSGTTQIVLPLWASGTIKIRALIEVEREMKLEKIWRREWDSTYLIFASY
jgi:hypothetical protein